jgi:hypothetical protein
MQEVQDFLHKLNDIEVLILRLTAFLGVVIFCGSMLWSHIKELRSRHKSKDAAKDN